MECGRKIDMRYLLFILSLFLFAGCTTPGRVERPELANLNILLKKGDKAFQKNSYIKAVQCYIDAVLEAEELAPDRLDSIKQKLGAAYLDWARSLYWKAKQDRSERLCRKAITMAQRASEIDLRRKIQCKVLIKKLNKDLASIKYENVTDMKTLNPLYKERQLQIDLLCKQAKIFFDSGQYMRARDKYEEVLLINPFNLNAIRGLKKVMKEVTRIGAERKKVDEQERMAEVEWNYVQAIVMKEKQAQKSIQNSLEEKLAGCVIEELNFNDTALDQVFALLQKEIRTALKNNFTFKFEGFSPDDKKLAPVTFNVKDIPADDAVKVICEGMKLDYKYLDDNIVVLPRKAH
jgi:general secretion pathway protein D